jgi:hypothetical protein
MNQTMPVKKVAEDFTQSLMKPIAQNTQNQELGAEHGPNSNNHHAHSIEEEIYGGK